MKEDGSPSQQLGKYQRVATLGQGGMGTVHLALANGFGHFRKLIVVKELRQDLIRQKGFIRLFMDEAKLAARLSHPNVVETFEAIHEGNRYFLTMEYLDGQPLSALTKRLGSRSEPLPLGMHIQILCEVLSGLHYAHELQDYDGSSLHVVHRDVSPQNVFLTYHGEVKVVDFGVAKAANASVSTAPGVFVGKFAYAAPEQVVGRNVDARTDVFAVGVMLWQAMSERRFSSSAPTPEAFRARAEGTEPRIAEVVPDVDPRLAAICDRALAVNPEERYASAQAFRAALQEYLQQAGLRVEAAEIGQLMRSVFEEERRALHRVIEAAVHASGTPSGAEPMGFLESLDKEPTAVADLSNLVDVSLQRDDQKIREAYAHTKITRVLSPSKRPPAPPLVAPPPAHEPPPPAPTSAGVSDLAPARTRQWLLAAGLLGACVAGAFYLVSQQDNKPAIQAKPLSPSVAVTTPSPNDSHLSSSLLPENRPEPQPAVTAPVATPVAPARNARPAPAPVRPRSPAPSERPVVSTTPVVAVTPTPAPTPEPVKPAAAVSGSRVEAGTDLGAPRREGPTRIDLDNPYR